MVNVGNFFWVTNGTIKLKTVGNKQVNVFTHQNN